MSSTPNTLLVDGTDIRTLAGITIVGYMDLHAPGTLKGSDEDEDLPGDDGVLGVPLPYAAYSFSVPIRVFGATRGQKEARLRAVGAAVRGTNGLVTLTRRLANAADDGYDEHTAHGRFAMFNSISLLNPFSDQTELQFVNLDGYWLDGDGVTKHVP